ncbi:hypothetical protein, partial [Thalassovita aquimarina]|uniref:hypothetical protein n=1 Tax=Thalassovita aquimarina TaxID=2785917 RepID=UPI001BAF21CB
LVRFIVRPHVGADSSSKWWKNPVAGQLQRINHSADEDRLLGSDLMQQAAMAAPDRIAAIRQAFFYPACRPDHESSHSLNDAP